MIPVVPNAELALDDHRHARRGPMFVRETVGDRRLAVNLGQARQLLAGEPARPPGRFAALERVDTFICQCPVPTEIGRASCRERVYDTVGAGVLREKETS